MKKLMILFVVLFLGSIALAQPKDHQSKLEQLSTQLNLTETQKTQLKPIFMEMQQKRKEMQDAAGTKPTKEQMQAAMKPYQAKIEAILTAEQMAKFKELRKQEHQERGQQRP